MSDSGKKQRPNANYKLSNENADGAPIVYHYSRERRLEKAPQAVRDLYKEEPVYRFNLLRPLIRTRPMAMMFIVIVIACVMVLAVSALGLLSDSHNLEGNELLVQAIKYEDTIIVAINKTIKQAGLDRYFRSVPAYTGAVDIAVQPVLRAENPNRQPEDIIYHKIFFTLEKEEYYRFSVPFDAEELAIVLKTEQKSLGLTVKPK